MHMKNIVDNINTSDIIWSRLCDSGYCDSFKWIPWYAIRVKVVSRMTFVSDLKYTSSLLRKPSKKLIKATLKSLNH